MQKICYYNIHKKKFGWGSLIPKSDNYVDNTTCCIMSIAESKTIYSIDLDEMLSKKIISIFQFNSIRNFDYGIGTINDFNIIKQLAKTFNIILTKVKLREVNKVLDND